MGSPPSASTMQPEHSSENRDPSDLALSMTPPAGHAEPGGGSGSAFTTIFQHIRDIFFHSEDDTLCLLLKDWTTSSVSAQVVSPPPNFSFEPGQYIHDEPLEDGRLRFCVKVPAEYPSGKRGFFTVVQTFLERKDIFGIRAVYLQELAIEKFLSSLKDDFKAKSKATGKNKGKGPKGKRLKWKNPFTVFGCRVVWAHDLSTPETLYLRVRCVDKDTSALVVVDTNDLSYKIGLSSDKVCPSLLTFTFFSLLTKWQTKFINAATLHLHIQLRLFWWQTYFHKMAVQHLGSWTGQATPEDQWWWSVIQGHREQCYEQPAAEVTHRDLTTEGTHVESPQEETSENLMTGETHGDLTTEDTHKELPKEETPKELTTEDAPENLIVEEPEEVTSPHASTNDVSAEAKAPIAYDVPVANIDNPNALQQPEPPAAEASSSQPQKSKNKKKKNKKKKGNKAAGPGHMEPNGTPVTLQQEAPSHSVSSIPVHEPSTTSRLPSFEATAQSDAELQHQVAITVSSTTLQLASSDTTAQSHTEQLQGISSSESQSTSLVETSEASQSLDSSQDHTPSISLTHLPQDTTTSQPHYGTTGHNLVSESTPAQPISEETPQATKANGEDKSNTSTTEEATMTLVGTGPTPDEPSSLSHDNHAIENTAKPTKLATTPAHDSFDDSLSEEKPVKEAATPNHTSDKSLLEETPASSNEKDQIETASDFKRPTRSHGRRRRRTRLSSVSSSILYTIAESDDDSHTEGDDHQSEGNKQLQIENDMLVSQDVEPVTSEISPEHNIPTSAQPSPKKNDKKSKKKNRGSESSAIERTTTGTPTIVTQRSNNTSTKTQDAQVGIQRSARNASGTFLQDHSTQRSETRPSPVPSGSHTSRPESDLQQAGGQGEWNVVSRARKSQPSSARTFPAPRTSAAPRTTEKTQLAGISPSPTQKPSERRVWNLVSHPPPVLNDADFPPLPSQRKPQQEQGPTIAATASANSSTTDLTQWSGCKTETTVRSVKGDDDDDDNDHDNQTGLERDEAKPSPAVTAQTNNNNAETVSGQRETTSRPHDRGALPSASTASSSQPSQPGPRRPAGWFWQLDSHGFPCALAGCDKRCSSWDGASVICPRCGPYSEVRYCGEEHLFADIKAHWPYCGQMTFRHPCRESSIPRQQREGPPLLPSRHNWDTPERHRQAVRHAVDRSGDYFIFSDWADWMAAGQPDDILDVRCSNRVVWVVSFDDREDRDRFRRVLGVCLFASIEVVPLVGYLFRMIRDNLRVRGVWNSELDAALRYQMKHELAVPLLPATTGTRHACQTDWDGRSRRACPDPVCQAEYVPLLGESAMGMGAGTAGGAGGFRRLCDYWEANFWLLRAARLTHPHVAQVAARTRGEGFDEVLPEDRRLFRRGEGWDGAGTGEMEIEGLQF
ncbi:hypothetical protein VTN96DRAFT_531 [Rasamsonia emersonii]